MAFDLWAPLAVLAILFLPQHWLARGHAVRLVARALFFAALTAILISHGIVPFVSSMPFDGTLLSVVIPLAKVAWWLLGASCLIGLVRVFLIFERKPREARLLQDLVVAAIYFGAFFSIVSFVFSMPIGTLAATSGVFVIVLGLALQSTLSDVFSGIALNIGRPYTVGDWIVLDESIEGRVVETNWRATYLLSGSADLVAVPNSTLAKMKVVNRSAPDAHHGVSVKIELAPLAKPSALIELMETVLASSNLISKSFQPSVNIVSLDARAIELELSFKVSSLDRVGAAKSEIFDLVFRHVYAAGLAFAQPVGAATSRAEPLVEASEADASTARRLLNSIPLLASLTEAEKQALSAGMVRKTFRKGTTIAPQGEVMRSLLVVRSGIVAIERDGKELLRLSPGDWFGEGGLLMGAEETGTSRAITSVIAYEMDQDDIAALLKDRPTIADEVGAVLARRLEDELRMLSPTKADPPKASFSARIRRFFEIGEL